MMNTIKHKNYSSADIKIFMGKIPENKLKDEDFDMDTIGEEERFRIEKEGKHFKKVLS
jgi:hypothetical protein